MISTSSFNNNNNNNIFIENGVIQTIFVEEKDSQDEKDKSKSKDKSKDNKERESDQEESLMSLSIEELFERDDLIQFMSIEKNTHLFSK